MAPMAEIGARLDEALKQAMRAKDTRTLDVVRGLKAKMQEKRTSPGFKGEVDDALWTEVIGAYKKQMEKAFEEYEKVGERGAEMRDKLAFEIQFCGGYLPQGLSRDEIRARLADIIARLGATDPKAAGKVMGEFMKANKGLADGKEVKALAEELLGGAK